MAKNESGAPGPRSSFTIIHQSDGSHSNPLTVELEDENVKRAEVDVDWDGDTVRIEVRRLEDDPQVEVVLR